MSCTDISFFSAYNAIKIKQNKDTGHGNGIETSQKSIVEFVSK